MKIIDLLNKIANGEEVPKYIRYRDISKHKYNTMMVCKENIIYQLDQCVINLNDEVEILEEKKITEKWNDLSFTTMRKKTDSIDDDIEKLKSYIGTIMRTQNEIIDYLKSKGE